MVLLNAIVNFSFFTYNPFGSNNSLSIAVMYAGGAADQPSSASLSVLFIGSSVTVTKWNMDAFPPVKV